MYRFPGRALLDRLLVLPLAMPTYIVAYATWSCWTSPVRCSARCGSFRLEQGARLLVSRGAQHGRRGAGAVGGALPLRLPFGARQLRAAVRLRSGGGAHAWPHATGTFWSVALPLARPALAAGVALALMECLNDLGAVQYLGVRRCR